MANYPVRQAIDLSEMLARELIREFWLLPTLRVAIQILVGRSSRRFYLLNGMVGGTVQNVELLRLFSD